MNPSSSIPSAPTFGRLSTAAAAVLPPATAAQFNNAVKYITRPVDRSEVGLESRRETLREIVMGEKQILKVYNEFALAQGRTEMRAGRKLPVFGEENMLEVMEGERRDESPRDLRGTEKARNERGKDIDHKHNGRGRNRAAREVRLQVNSQTLNVGLGPKKPKKPQAEPITTRGPRLLTTQFDSTHGIEHMGRVVPAVALAAQSGTLIPVQNFGAFPVERIREVQSQQYPSTAVTGMAVHCSTNGTVVQVTADIDNGPVNHLLINNPRIITALGLRNGDHDTLTLDSTALYVDETFTVAILPNQHPEDLDSWLVGELHPARYSYLSWLDLRHCVNPKTPPFMSEAKVIAKREGRRYMDVWRELEKAAEKEWGSGGSKWREEREKWLGESPKYAEGQESRIGSMFR